MTPRLKKAIAMTAEFSGATEEEVSEMAAANLETGIAQAQKVAKQTLSRAIKKVHIGGAVRSRGRSRARKGAAAQTANA